MCPEVVRSVVEIKIERETGETNSLSTPPSSCLFFHLYGQEWGSLVEKNRLDGQTRWACWMSQPDIEASQEGRRVTVS